MRAYPHKPDADAIEDDLAMSLSLIDTDPKRIQRAVQSKNQQFFIINAEQAQSAAQYNYALETPRKQVLEFMETAVGHWLAALDAGALLDPDQYIHALSLALVCGDQKAVHRLAALGRDKYTHPAVEMSEVAYSLAGLLGELAGPKPGSKRAAAVEKAAAARAGTTPNIQDLAVPVALAVVAQDSAALQSASAAHLAGYSKIFKKSALRQRADSFLDCWSLGFLRIAVGKKMTLPGNNVYWGEALLTA